MVDTDTIARRERERASSDASHGTPASLSASERNRMRMSKFIIRTAATLPDHLNMTELVGYIQNHEEAFKR